MTTASHDPITLEIIQNSLQATADEISNALGFSADTISSDIGSHHS